MCIWCSFWSMSIVSSNTLMVHRRDLMILMRTSGLRISLKAVRMSGMLQGEIGMIGLVGSAMIRTPGWGVGNQGCSFGSHLVRHEEPQGHLMGGKIRGQSSIVVDAVTVLGNGAEILREQQMAQRYSFSEPKGEVISRLKGNKVEASLVKYSLFNSCEL